MALYNNKMLNSGLQKVMININPLIFPTK